MRARPVVPIRIPDDEVFGFVRVRGVNSDLAGGLPVENSHRIRVPFVGGLGPAISETQPFRLQ